MSFVAIFIGLSLESIVNPDNIVKVLFFYIIFDLLIRVIFLNNYNPPLSYLYLPINKKAISTFVNIINSFNTFNIFSLLLWNSLIIFNFAYSFYWCILISTIFFTINNVALLIIFLEKLYYKVITIVIIGFSFTLLYRFLPDSNLIVGQKIYLLVFFILCVVLYFFNKKNIIKRLYVDKKILRTVFNDSFKFSSNDVNPLYLLELKLIIRNNRPRTYIILSLFFSILFCLMLLDLPSKDFILSFILFSLATSMGVISYSQFLISWSSEHFKFILINAPNRLFIKAKIKILNLLCWSSAFILTPFLLFNLEWLKYTVPLVLFNLGLNNLLIVLLAMNDSKKLSLSHGAFLNYEGTTINTFFIILGCVGLPFTIMLPFYLLNISNFGLLLLSLLGILGIVYRRFLLDKLSLLFKKYKYKLIESFEMG